MEKQIFDIPMQSEAPSEFRRKQTFDDAQISPDEPLEGELLEEHIDEALAPQKSRLGKIFAGLTTLFGIACLAQTIQWIYDAIVNHQWIYLAFSLIGLAVVLVAFTEIIAELHRLRALKRRQQLRDQTAALWDRQQALEPSAAQVQQQCLDIADNLQLNPQSPAIQQWQQSLNEAYSPQEVAQLFSQQVLSTFDKRAKKLISQMAAESAVLVAISPLALVDILFVAWRGIRLINKIAQIYGIELGYFTRIRLLRLVLVNMAFAGATELVQDWGMDWLSQDLSGKLSARIAQGLGVGLLTARLGIKAIEFCRPLTFRNEEKLKLKHIQKELLGVLKETVLGKTPSKQPEKNLFE
ncbi:inner membrane protein [Haemophilus pittmaniae]|uniref:UPF0283 membrane protein NCTC13335_01906 n=1 Tax=Haemophilus pittmaniae TaxID=249188 RepID=A0A377J0E7_9PAST|nr:TIGR01620 family protein [Haemophilus pittmaniae]STO93991.1 inner membrane protein [Haemophilus pittmaniae]